VQAEAGALFHRLAEATNRPAAVAHAQAVLQDLVAALHAWANEDSMPQVTVEERDQLRAAVDEVQRWIEVQEAAQAVHAPSETPLFESQEVLQRLKKVQEMHAKLLKKPKLKVPVIKTTTGDSDDSAAGEQQQQQDGEVKVELEGETTKAKTDEPAAEL
jgi:iron-sulfur cluster repair protein YtfE (RIC family)